MGLDEQIRYFRNDGQGTFTERTDEAGLKGIVSGLNMIHADYDNDGDNDILVLRGGWLTGGGEHPNSLLRNRGDGRFDDVTQSAGLLSFRPTQTAVWADFDNDGWLDLFVGNETTMKKRHPCELYRNNRDGTFSDKSADLGMTVCETVKGAVSGDFDNDGRQDLYLSRYGSSNLLLINKTAKDSGKWRFEETSEKAGVSEPLLSFPAWVWDYDNDGWLDIFVSTYGTKKESQTLSYHANAYTEFPLSKPTRSESAIPQYLDTNGNPKMVPRLYRNEGNGRFSDQTSGSGLAQILWTMGSNFGDIDNDGRLDLYLGTGAPEFRSLTPNRLFRGDAQGRFQDVTTAAGTGHLQKGHAIVFADLDNDGDQDIYASLGGAYEGDKFANALFANPGHGNAWVTLKLKGTKANRSAIGARIKVMAQTPTGQRQFHHVVSTGASFGSGSLQQEIGLGNATAINSVEILWPGSGQQQEFYKLPMRKIWLLTEDSPIAKEITLPQFDLAQLESGNESSASTITTAPSVSRHAQ